MTATELIDKYGLSEEELRTLFIQLEGAGAKPLELYGRSPINKRGQGSARIRFSPRHKVPWPVPVIDTQDPEIEGVLVDLTEHGLCVKGIETYVTEVRNLTIKPENLFAVNAIQLRAICRWVGQTGAPTNYAAGFQITHISQEGSQALRKLIGSVVVPEIELDMRGRINLADLSDSAMTSDELIWTCPFCRAELSEEPDECPQCGIVVAEYQGAADSDDYRIQAPEQEDLSIQPTHEAEQVPSVSKAIVVPEKIWKELESLGGEVNDHVIRALADYLSKNRAELPDRLESRVLT